MKVKCYYCGYHTDRSGLCPNCVCYNYIQYDGIYKTVMFVMFKSTQFTIDSYVIRNITYVHINKKTILTLPGTPLTPKNVKQKLSLYLTFS